MGRTQGGNNNAYCQDNEISWVDWKLDDRRRALIDFSRKLVKLRNQHAVLQRPRFLVGDYIWDSTAKDMAWLRPDGEEMTPEDWQKPWISSMAFMLGGDARHAVDERGERRLDDSVLGLMNAYEDNVTFKLPGEGAGGTWMVQLDTADPDKAADTQCQGVFTVTGRGLVVLRQPLEAQAARAAAAAPARAAQRAAQRRRRRAGLILPLFSLRSDGGWGIGEIPDLPRFAEWAGKAGFSVLQLLPVTEVGGAAASPYY